MVHQDRQGFFVETERPHFVVLFAELLKEMLSQRQDVFLALSQGRHHDMNDVQPVEQIFPKAAFLNRFLQVCIGRGHHADVYANRFV